jgi:polysaccharide biosynthesis transport protein
MSKTVELFQNNDNEQILSIWRLFNIVLRGQRIILAVFILVFSATAIYTYTIKKVYAASASVLIDKRGQSSKLSSPILDFSGMSDEKDIQNEMEILHSQLLAENVARILLETKIVDSTTMEPIDIIKISEDEKTSSPFATPREVANRLLNIVTFDPVANSNVIKINVKCFSAQEAALLANTYATAYYERNLFVSRTRSRSVREFLDGQMKEQQQKLSNAENDLQAYMQTHKIVSLDEESKKVITQLAQLEASRDAANIDIQSMTKTLESYKQEVIVQEPDVARAIEEVNDSYITLLQDQIAKLEVERDVTLSQNTGTSGQDMYKQRLNEINAQVSQLRGKLQKRTIDFLKSIIPEGMSGGAVGNPRTFLSEAKMKIIQLKIDIQQLKAKKDALSGVIVGYEKQFNSLPQKSIDFARLERTRMSNEKLYLFLRENSSEAQVKERSDFGYIYIIDPAIVQNNPISPRVTWNLILGMIAGLGLGIVVAYLRETINVRVGTPDDMKKRGHLVLASIPLMNSEIRKLSGKPMIERDGKMIDAHLITFVNPLSYIAEAYRRLRVNLQYARIDQTISTLLLTSPDPGDGKSTTVANLATTFAQAGKKTLIICTDFRKPTLHTTFNVEKIPGLIEALHGSVPLDSVIHRTSVDGLDLIPCGSNPVNTSDILGSKRMKDLIDQLKKKKRYDMIVFDSPPILMTTDPLVLSLLVDGMIMVVSSGKTLVASLDRALESIQAVKSRYLGLVINNFDLRTAAGYYRSGYNYKYSAQVYGNLPELPTEKNKNMHVSSQKGKSN